MQKLPDGRSSNAGNAGNAGNVSYKVRDMSKTKYIHRLKVPRFTRITRNIGSFPSTSIAGN